MKNITVLSVLVTIIFLFSAINSLNSEELSENIEQSNEETEAEITEKRQRRYGASIGVHLGFIYGKSIELVYPTDTKGKYLSQLLWNMKPLYYSGINIDVGLNDIMSGKGYFSTLSFKAGFPVDSGIHENRDWMSIENSRLTHYSKHTNRTDNFFLIDWHNGISIPVSIFYLKPFINFSWMHFSFSGSNGHGTYARGKKYDKDGIPTEDHSQNPTMFYPILDNPRKIDYYGKLITYDQDWLLVAAGFSFGTNILSLFSINLSFQISPLTFCTAIDQHLTTGNTYYDYTGFGLFLEGGGNFSFKWNFLVLSLELNYRYVSNTRGYTVINKADYYAPNESGAGLSLMDTRFIIKFQF